MYPHYENLFIVRPIENADPAALGKTLDVAPEKVMVEVLSRG